MRRCSAFFGAIPLQQKQGLRMHLGAGFSAVPGTTCAPDMHHPSTPPSSNKSLWL